jgi:hypothetical protein
MSAPTLPQPIEDAAASVRTVVCYLRTATPARLGNACSAASAASWSAWPPPTAGPSWNRSRICTSPVPPCTGPACARPLALLADHQADTLLATDSTRLAVTPQVADELAAVARRQGWRLLTVELLTTRSPAPPSASGRTGGPA